MEQVQFMSIARLCFTTLVVEGIPHPHPSCADLLPGPRMRESHASDFGPGTIAFLVMVQTIVEQAKADSSPFDFARGTE
jgi:hypothetical protein